MMSQPLVSVVCLCYNHAHYVSEAIYSVLEQTYPAIELIIVDDGSSDQSQQVITEALASIKGHRIKFIPLPSNHGYCSAFNIGYAASSGDYIIDLAADDVLLPNRVARGIDTFQQHDDTYGVNFTDAELITDDHRHLYNHSDRFPHHTIPQGDVYKALISRYFICSPTMLVSRALLQHLGGYDESLAYEDFDLWIRGSRIFKFCYTPEVLLKKRVLPMSLSDRQFQRNDVQRYSTYTVCTRILTLNRNRAEQKALQKRILYEMRLCIQVLDFTLVLKYASLLRANQRMRYAQ